MKYLSLFFAALTAAAFTARAQNEENPDWQATPPLSVEQIQEMMGQGTIAGGTIIGSPSTGSGMSAPPPGTPQGLPLFQKSFKTAPTPVVAGNAADNITPEIESLARGLQYDPLTIFNWVRNHIDYECYYGSKKGAHLTLMEMAGNDYDQASLMIALLRASGHAATYCAGPVGFTYDFICSSTGLDNPYGDLTDAEFAAKVSTVANPVSPTDPNLDVKRKEYGVGNFFTSRGFPRIDASGGSVFTISHVWVRFTHGGQVMNVSPSIKSYSGTTPPNLTPAGLNKTALLAAANATVDAIDGKKWVKNINYTALSGLLSTSTSQLAASIRTNHDGAAMDDLLAMRKIIPVYHQDFASVAQISAVNAGWANLETWNEAAIPADRMAWLHLTGGDVSVNGVIGNNSSSKPLYLRSMPMAELAGRKFSLTYSGANFKTADFSLDDVVDSSFPLYAHIMVLKVQVLHPHYSIVMNTSGVFVRDAAVRNGSSQITNYSSGINQFVYPGNTVPFCYVIISSFSNPRKLLRKRLEILEDYNKRGVPDTENRVRTESLYAMGMDWFDQTWRYSRFSSARNGIIPLFHNRIGQVAQQGSYYIDVAQQLYSVDHKQLNEKKTYGFLGVQSLMHSAMEHAVVNQNVGRPLAVSTVEMLWRANQAGEEIYRMTTASWASEKSNLSNYSSSDTSFLDARFVQADTMGLLPKSGNRLVNQWRGAGYSVVTAGLRYSMRISGGLNGGFGSLPGFMMSGPLVEYLLSAPSYESSPSNVVNVPFTPHGTPKQVSWDPVDMMSGAFLYEKTELEVTHQSFARHYNSHMRLNALAGLGNGWTHDHDIRLAERSSTLASLGGTNSYQAAATHVATLAMEMVYDSSSARDWALAALIARWAAEQTFAKAVGITFGNKTIEFVKMPDGTFIPPPGMNYTLAVSGGTPATATADSVLGIYTLTERNGPVFLFNSKGRISRITDPNGNIRQSTYNGSDQLTTVTDGFGGTFTYTWTGGRISSVADGTGRSVGFVYDSGNLISVTDVAGGVWTYRYDASNRLDRIADPATRAIVENTYDSGNRIATQRSMGETPRTWCYAWNGFRNLEETPTGNITGYHYDERGRSVGISNPIANTSWIAYDGQDRIIATTDSLNQTTTRVWNSDNNLVTETDALFETASFFYDAAKRLQTLRDKRGKDTAYTYNTAHQPLTVTDPLGHVTTCTYLANGLLNTVKDGENKTTTRAYDSWGGVNKITAHDGTFQTMVNNARGDVLTVTDAAGRIITNTWNARRQLLTTTLPAVPGEPAAVITNVYDSSGNLQSTTDANNATTSHIWNALGKEVTSTLPALTAGNNVLTTAYDLRNLPVTVTNSLGHIIATEYDNAQRPTATSDPLVRRTETTLDANDQPTQIKDPLNRITQFTWNPRGEKTRTTDALSHYTNSTLDANGNQTLLRNRRAKNFIFTYDDANRLTALTTPTGKTTATTYFNNNLVKTITEPSTQTTTLFYNGKNLLLSKTDPAGTITYGYNPAGDLLTVTEGASIITRTYDERGRLKTFTTADGDFIQYRYDANNNLTRITYPPDTTHPAGKQVNYTYNARNLLATVTDWNNRQTTYQYDRLGRLTGTTRPNDTSNQIAHDDAGQITSIRETAGGKLINYLAFQYDAASQIKTRFRAPVANSGWQHPSITATYDDDNRLANVNGQPVTHDDDGNMTNGPIRANSGFLSLAYNARNQLTTADGINYTYDAEGRRRTISDATGTTRDITDPSGKLLIRINPDLTKTYYVYGLGLLYEVDQFENTKTYHFDQVGSTIARTDGTGKVIGKAEYSAYGIMFWSKGDMATPFLYNGQAGVQTDSNGLLNMRARYYSPYLMRFLNADPSGFSGGSNWFAYADGNPISLTDPFGLCSMGGVPANYVSPYDADGTLNWTGIGNYLWQGIAGTPEYVRQNGARRFTEHITDPTFVAINALGGMGMGGITGGLRNVSRGAQAAKGGMTLADDMAVLRQATTGKGNFGVGAAGADDAARLGRSWVGEGAEWSSSGKALVSPDGLRQFRPPSLKPNSPYATTGSQANFEWRNVPSGQWQGNGHLNITPP